MEGLNVRARRPIVPSAGLCVLWAHNPTPVEGNGTTVGTYGWRPSPKVGRAGSRYRGGSIDPTLSLKSAPPRMDRCSIVSMVRRGDHRIDRPWTYPE